MTQLYEKRGNRYVPVSAPMLDSDGGLLVVCGLRYALGSTTYMPGVAMQWTERNWDALPDKTRHVALRDTVEWLSDRQLFDKPGDDVRWDCRREWSAWAQTLLTKAEPAWAAVVVNAALHSPESRMGPESAPFLRFIQEAKSMTDDEYKAMTEHGAKAWAGVTNAGITELRDGGMAELEALRKDAECYRWLVERCGYWSWSPSRWSASKVSGFSADDASYKGYDFQESLAMAMARTREKKEVPE